MMTDCALAVITESASSVAFARSSTWSNQRSVAWGGDGLPHVECECSAASMRPTLQLLLRLEPSTNCCSGGGGLHLVGCGHSDHETAIAATAPLGAINELLFRGAMAVPM